MRLTICTDVAKLKAHPLIKIVGNVIPITRTKILGTGGSRVYYNGNRSIACLSDTNGLDELLALDFMTTTNYEEVFGYRRQASDKDGNLLLEEAYTVTPDPYPKYTDNWIETDELDEFGSPAYVNEPIKETITPESFRQVDPTMEIVEPIAEMAALYHSIYQPEIITNEDGTTRTPPARMGESAGYDSSHLLTGE